MNLDDIRDASRAAVHAMFSLPAVVSSPDGVTQVPITARLHRDLRKPFGDLDREGFALVIEQYNQVIIDREEWEPQSGWKIDFGRGRVFRLADELGDRADRYMPVEVVISR